MSDEVDIEDAARSEQSVERPIHRQEPTRSLNADSILKLAIAAAILTVALSVGYYFVVYIPKRDADNQARAAAAQSAQAAQQAQRDAQARQTQTARRDAYNSCIADASAVYAANWESSCRTQSDERAEQYQSCISGGLYNIQQCLSMYPALPPSNCTLPAAVGNRWDQLLKTDKDKCLEVAKDGL